LIKSSVFPVISFSDLEHFIFRANNLCEVNLLEVEIIYGFGKNQHGIGVEIVKSGTEDFGTRICRDCKGFARIKYCWSVGQGWLLD
jgi:hypothetical protein